jgi:hypothetical protein
VQNSVGVRKKVSITHGLFGPGSAFFAFPLAAKPDVFEMFRIFSCFSSILVGSFSIPYFHG